MAEGLEALTQHGLSDAARKVVNVDHLALVLQMHSGLDQIHSTALKGNE